MIAERCPPSELWSGRQASTVLFLGCMCRGLDGGARSMPVVLSPIWPGPTVPLVISVCQPTCKIVETSSNRLTSESSLQLAVLGKTWPHVGL